MLIYKSKPFLSLRLLRCSASKTAFTFYSLGSEFFFALNKIR